jgi:hypothetical protein
MEQDNIELGPLSESALTLIYQGLEIPNTAAIQSMIREICKCRGIGLSGASIPVPEGK